MWIFAYGSLMWNPGFAHAERVIARLAGHARRFCLASMHYRGTPESPGLVLALDPDPGAVCTGIAYRALPGTEAATLAYLRARELVSYAYREARLPVDLADGRRVEAVTFVSDPGHPQFRPGLDPEEQARIIARAEGPAGTNRDYLFSTLAHLHELGIPDPELDSLAERVRRLSG
ncbi:MAG: gamma-glutamylcyclotransferase [Alphaproteobacteria bacterium]|nr:MAG: gamma-glutamylcyclotransferase [Alphaproteobacteria bacterium]